MTGDVAEDPDAAGEPGPRGGRRARKGHDDDPFADLVLDESFVKGASVYEAPARTRAAVRRYPSAAPASPRTRRRARRATATAPASSPRDWSPAEEPPARRRGRLLVGVGTVLVLALGTAYLVFGGVLRHPATRKPEPTAAAATALAASPTSDPGGSPGLAARDYRRGHCYRWDDAATYTEVDEVTCDSAHLFESAADDTVSLAAELPLGAGYPAEDQWTDIVTRRCRQTVEQFLGYPLDPHGRFYLGSIRPTDEGWQTGDRKLVCGLNGYSPGVPAPAGQLDLFSGKAEGADQSWVYPAGTCLSSADGTGQDTEAVSCAAPHQYVAIGNVHLSDPPGAAPPADASFTRQAEQRCAAVARGALGGSFRETPTVRLGWYTIAPESWRAGTRGFTCTVRYTDGSDKLRNVTGDQLHPAQDVLA
ncbi:septum formation family protein [Pseudofrankia sp. DC12]|uniref:septum formation family protein n=1 Tax=Pseudofrankia sp. DC12 TaxID=683315 RepID=UPI0005F8025E|nr:septum formation family protein [Pseudofrankia sp. DC12]